MLNYLKVTKFSGPAHSIAILAKKLIQYYHMHIGC